ncbi:MAG: HEAT repeat domain-containing protein [Planctomycetes bacterium]|nr:HEAT repeat domain-containing protein [Planctomycetota bacterium]
MVRISLLVLASFLLQGPSPAQDEQRVLLTLWSGETVEGLVLRENREGISFETFLGRREIPLVAVVHRRPAAPLREAYRRELQETRKDEVADRVRLARWCLAHGFTSGLAAELDAVLRLDPGNAFAAAMIDRLAPVYRLAGPNSQPIDKPRWARDEAELLYLAARKQSFLGAALISRQLAGLPMEAQISEAIDMVERGSEPQRYVAVQALGRSAETRRVKPLYRRALGDPSPQVRHEANRSLIRHDDGSTAGPFIKALLRSEHAAVRSRAAESLAMLGDRRAVPALINALAAAGSGGAPRNNVHFGRQQAYLKDFDVEIAQAAVIADPIVDVVGEGVVLDVAAVSVGIERRTYVAALNRLTGADHGGDARSWAEWWRANGDALLEGRESVAR